MIALFGLGVLAGMTLKIWIDWKLGTPPVKRVIRPRRWIQ